jgi:Fe-S-cluster formation regulator IscX/YfhJ
VFVYTENLVVEQKTMKQRARKVSGQKKGEPDPLPLLEKAFELAVQEGGWARLDLMGNALYQLDPGFDPRTYGHRQLSRLVASLKEEFEMRTQEINGSTLVFVRARE